MPTLERPEDTRLLPGDEHDRMLASNVRPDEWVPPRPAGRYNLVVIGAGTAGLVAAAGAASLGARVALVERDRMGGDCLNFGCVPSKALLRAARAWASVRDAGQFGVEVPPGARVDFPSVMRRMRRLRAAISPHDSAARFRDLGVHVFLGEGRFTGPDSVRTGDAELRFRKACIATGTRPRVPRIPGLAEAGYRTNETIFSRTELPRRLAVLGSGPIGCEMAQAFARFGSGVHLFEVESRLLAREDPEASRILHEAFGRDGIDIHLEATVERVSVAPTGRTLHFQREGVPRRIEVDEILVAVGRVPGIESLDLERAGVEHDPRRGILVDDRLRTSNRRIYAAGDVASPYRFTHAADFLARIVVRNALFFGRAKASSLTLPWCTYTDPEVAHVGLYEREARERGIETSVFVQELADVDRAVLDGEDAGFVKLLVARGSDRILGATIVASHAGDLVAELTTAIRRGIGLASLAETIHPYPTQGEAIRKLGDAYNRTRLTPRRKRLLERYFAWTR